MTFRSFAMVDWSGGKDTGPSPRRDAIWIATVIDGEEREPIYMRNRVEALGWLAGLIMKRRGFGFIGNMVIGVLGAVIAGFILPQIGVDAGGGLITSIVSATFGAVVLLFVIGLIKKA